MPRRSFAGLAILFSVVFLSGCAGPRFVEVNREGGVIALPSNDNSWPTYHRDKAEAMLQKRFPGGYEIVREEEFVTGQAAHTHTETEHQDAPALVLAGGDSSTTTDRKGRERTSSSLGGIAIPLGQSETTTRQHTTYSDITEWRIYVRAK